MLRHLGEYLLRLVTRSYNGKNFNSHRACWYAIFEVNLSAANLSAEHVEENLSKVNLFVGKENLSAAGWIIPRFLRNNGIHCVFV